MGKPTQSKTPEPTRTPSLREWKEAIKTNVAERTPGDLSVEQVQRIRAYKKSGASYAAIAAELRLDRRHVSDIVNFRVRADVPRPFETDCQRTDREAKHHENERKKKARLEVLSARKAKSSGKKADEEKAGGEHE